MKTTLKISIIIVLLLSCISLFSQENNSKNITLITSPGAYKDGFNIGVQYEHQWNLPYVGGEIFHFPDLNNIGYWHVIGRAGINQEYNAPLNLKAKWNVGFRGGRVFRSGYNNPYVLLGGEIGAQITHSSGVYVKLTYSPDSKTDSKIWNRDNHIVDSVWTGLGIRF